MSASNIVGEFQPFKGRTPRLRQNFNLADGRAGALKKTCAISACRASLCSPSQGSGFGSCLALARDGELAMKLITTVAVVILALQLFGSIAEIALYWL
jgi:hypothetical protein